MKRLFLYIFALLLAIPTLAQVDGARWVNTDYNTTEGTDFWVTFMRNGGKGKGDKDLFLRLFASAKQDADVEVWYNNDTLATSWSAGDSLMFHVPAMSMGGLENDHALKPPFVYVEDQDDKYKGVFIHSSTPISLYSLNYHEASYDAALVLPVSALHRDYIIQDFSSDVYATEFAIIATEDGTEVTINPQETSDDTEPKPLPTIIEQLDKGNTYIYRSSGSNIDLTGTTICANKPIGVFQGNQSGRIVSSNNHFYESSIPTNQLGKQYIVSQSANHNLDYVRITAVINNTTVSVDGTPVATLKANETYDLIIFWEDYPEKAVCIETDKMVSCGLYIENDDSKRTGASYSVIPPLESGVQSIISASFPFNSKYEQSHYINIFLPAHAIGSMQLDGEVINASEFHTLSYLINGIQYAFVQKKVTSGSHILTNPIDIFSSYSYGLSQHRVKIQTYYEAYAYSGGFRTTRPVDILIDDVLREKATICINEDPLKFSADIKYDYDSLRWMTFANGDNVFSGNNDSVMTRDFHAPGLDSIYLIVAGHTPKCGYPFRDTVVCYVNVHDTASIPELDSITGDTVRTICYNSKFTVHYKDPDGEHRKHEFIADTITPQNFFGKKDFVFKLNKEYFVVDSFKTTTCTDCDNGVGCDSMIYQRFIIRPTYDSIFYDTICVDKLPYYWKLSGKYEKDSFKIDTTQAWKNQYIYNKANQEYKPGRIDSVVTLPTICNCDSIIRLHLTVLPIYRIPVNPPAECADSGFITWPGHLDNATGLPLPGHRIYVNGSATEMTEPISKLVDYDRTYILRDSAKVTRCKECYGDLQCDSVWIFTKKIKKVTNINTPHCLCEDSSFVWLDTLWLGPKCEAPTVYEQKAMVRIQRYDTTLNVIYKTTEVGCDSIYYSQVHFNPIYLDYPDTTRIHICETDSFIFAHDPSKTVHKWSVADNQIKTDTFRAIVPTKVHCNGSQGCDSTVLHVVYIHPVYLKADKIDTICRGGEYVWEGHTPETGTNRYYWINELNKRVRFDSVPTTTARTLHLVDSLLTTTCIDCGKRKGCDSVWTKELIIGQVYNIPRESFTICESDTLWWQHHLYAGDKATIPGGLTPRHIITQKKDGSGQLIPTIFDDTVLYSTRYGCDSVLNIRITVLPAYTDSNTITLREMCDNDTLRFYDHLLYGKKFKEIPAGTPASQILAASATPYDRYFMDTTIYGCDSMAHHQILVRPIFDTLVYDTVCTGKPYTWTKHEHITIVTDSAGDSTYVDSIHTTTCPDCPRGYCDSVWRLQLYVAPIYDIDTAVQQVCDNGSFMWQGRLYAGPKYVPESGETIYKVLEVGVQKDSIRLQTQYACDSIQRITITVDTTTSTHISVHECTSPDGTYYFEAGGRTYPLNIRATYRDTAIRQTIHGCDSVVTLELIVDSTYHFPQSDRICQSAGGIYNWPQHSGKATLYDATTNQHITSIPAQRVGTYYYKDSCQTTQGCDSVYYLTLFVDSVYSIRLDTAICEGESFYWAGGDTTVRGDSIARTDTLQLGLYKYLSRIYVDSFTTIHGCDSIHTLNLTVKPRVYEREPDQHHSTSEPSIWWHDSLIVFDHVYKDTLRFDTISLRYGCDSIVEMYLTVDSAYVFKEDSIVCQNAPFTWTDHPGQRPYLYDQYGRAITTIPTDTAGEFKYMDSLKTTAGADSVHVLTLTVNPSYDIRDTLTICEGDSVLWDKQYWKGTAGAYDYTHPYTTVTYGCDSIMRLHLVIHPTYEATDEVHICDNESYNYHGHIFKDSAARPEPYLFDTILKSIHGCDSLIHFSLYVHHTYEIKEDSTTCQLIGGTYTWAGHTDRSINPVPAIPLDKDTVLTIIDSLKTLTCTDCHNGVGCDSVHILTLRILPIYELHFNKTMSEEDTCIWEGTIYGGTKTSFPHDKTVTKDTTIETKLLTHEVNGVQCDSIRYLHIKIGEVTRIFTNDVTCMNEPYTWWGKDHSGADSIRAIIPATRFTGKTVYDTLDKHLTTLGFDSIYYLHLDVQPYYPVTADRTNYDSVCQGSYKPWVGHDRMLYAVEKAKWVAPDAYIPTLPVGTYTFHDSIGTTAGHSCDSVWALVLRVDSVYDIIERDTICSNETYIWQGQTISDLTKGEHTFYANYQTIHKCDSNYTLYLYVWPTYEATDEVHICDNESYNYHGHLFKDSAARPEPYLFDTILKSIHGCDSLIHFSLYVYRTYKIVEDNATCQTDFYVWEQHEGHLVWDERQHKRISASQIPADIAEGTYTYIDSLKTVTCINCENGVGCDSIHILHLRIDSVYNKVDSITMSDEETRKWEHVIYIGTHVNKDTLSAQWFEPEVSQGLPKPYIVRVPQNQIVNYYDTTYPTIHGCDSTRNLVLLVGPTFRDTIIRYTCDNEPYHWYHEGDPYEVKPHIIKLEPKLYYDSLRTKQFGFDSIYVLDLRNNPTYHFEWSDTACQGTHYDWTRPSISTQVYLLEEHRWVSKTNLSTTVPGTYTYIDSLLTTDYELGEGQEPRPGCDSTWKLNLLVSPSYYFYDTLNVRCDNDSMSWQNRLYIGKEYLRFHKTFDPTLYDKVDTAKINQGYIYDTAYYYTHTFGCDSIYYLRIQYLPTSYSEQERNLCQEESGLSTWYEAMNNGAGGFVPTDIVQSITYWDTIPGVNSCDSVIKMTYHIRPIYRFPQDSLVCQDTTVLDWQWTDLNGNVRHTYKPISLAKPGVFTYYDSLSTQTYGCDSTYSLELTVAPSYYVHDTLTICQNDTVLWQDSVIVGDLYEGFITLPGRDTVGAGRHDYLINYGTYIPTYPQYSCDSIYTLHLIVHSATTYVTDTTRVTICDNETYHFKDALVDSVYNQHGEWKTGDHQTHSYIIRGNDLTTFGCDSVVAHVITVHPTYYFAQEERTCQDTVNTQWTWRNEFGDSIGVFDISKPGPQERLNKMHTIYGCDSIFGIKLMVDTIYRFDSTYVICENERVFWQGKWFAGDSAAVEQGDSILPVGLHGDTITRTTIHGCDSTHILHLIIHPIFHAKDSATICENNDDWAYTYTWVQHDAFGDEYIHIIPFDTIRALDPPVGAQKNDTIIYFTDTIPTFYGCDSIVTLKLTIHPVYQFHQDTIVCQDTINSDWIWTDQFGGDHSTRVPISIKTAGDYSYTDVLQTIDDCDSIFTLNIHIPPIYRFDSTYHICENERITWQRRQYSGDSVDIDMNDTIILAPGLHYDTAHYFTWEGCDSIFYLQLHVYPIYDTLSVFPTCANETFVWHQSDHYQHDSTYHDTIWTERMLDTTFIFPYQSLDIQDAKPIEKVYADRMLRTIHGCDSLSRLNLMVQPTYFFYTDTIICSNEALYYRGQKFWHRDTLYTEYLKTAAGCDSIYQLRMHVQPAYKFHRFVSTCDNGVIYHESQQGRDIVWDSTKLLTDTLTERIYYTMYGCDSIYLYHITIHPTYFSLDSPTVCSNEHYAIHDHHIIGQDTLYDQLVSGFVSCTDTLYKDSLSSQYGCDSVYWAQVHFAPSYLHVDYDTICDDGTTEWRDHLFVGNRVVYNGLPAGDHVFQEEFTTIDGCDSIFELRLCVHPTYDIHLTDSMCADDQYFWEYRTLEHLSIGWHDYDTTYLTIHGCDSTHYLHLLVKDTTNEFMSDTICQGDTLYLHGRGYTQTGHYKDTTLNAWGCHHFTYLNLYVTPPTRYTLSISDICADDQDITFGYDYTGLPLLEYSIYFDSLGHSQNFQDIIHAPIQDTVNHQFWIPVPSGKALPRAAETYFDSRVGINRSVDENKYAYPQPDIYPIRVVLHNGFCKDELQDMDTTLDVLYPSWIHEQHWNDGIVLYNAFYNGGYEFSAYQWYHNDTALIGQTDAILFLPDNLVLNPDTLTETSICPNEYSVQLTRKSDGHTSMTCPICPVAVVDSIVPRLDYYSVVPTLVPHEEPVVGILSSVEGSYTVTTSAGEYISTGYFKPDNKNYAGSITLPSVSGVYHVTLTSSQLEPRTCKVIVK